MTRPSRRLRLLILGLTCVALIALLRDVPATWLVLEDAHPRVDAAVVLAGDPGYERTRTAARLVLSNQARLLIVTGGEPGPGDSAWSLKQRAEALGVPSDRIRSEARSHSTREAMVEVGPILGREQVRTVALVTSPFHQRRAYLAARQAWPGVRIYNCPARPAFWHPQDWWRTRASRRIVSSEYTKLVYYFCRGWIWPSRGRGRAE